MLTHIHIKDFAIIENLEIEFQSGFTVMTGETGAGKSILIDALELTLGERADTQVIRHQAERCEISLNFDLQHIPPAQQWLIEHELASNQECIIRRVINRDGRSRSTINGVSSPLQLLRELGTLLVNIHGQHEHQSLLKRDKQRELLDNFAKHNDLCFAVEKTYQAWRTAKNELEKLRNTTRDGDARMELLRYQVQELEELALEENEVKTLDQEHKKLTSSEQLMASCNNAINLLAENETGAVLTLLHNANNQLENVKNLDNKINNAAKLLNEAIIQTEEATAELRDYLDSFDLNAERLQWVEQRLSTIHQLARKHHVHPTELANLSQSLKNELERIEMADVHCQKIQENITQLETEFQQVAKKLSTSRQQAAKKLSPLVSEKIQTLGMPGGQFAIQFEAIKDTLSPQGLERVEFMVSANRGQPLQPLHKVASGGELSRIGLAIQVIAAQKENTATLIFDEVDVGIGGGTAEIVGQLLRMLGKNAQVLCITHLPQVAAQGHQHFQVKKSASKDSTTTQIQLLNVKEKVAEIARMLGGVKITEQTLAHAREMLSTADAA